MKNWRLFDYKHNRGIGMIEAMVVVLIVSSSLITAGVGFIDSMNTIKESRNIVLASSHVSEMVEMIKVNSEAANAGAYKASSNNPPAKGKNCETKSCDPTELAKHQLKNWFDNIPPRLAKSYAEITKVNNGKLTVRLYWDNDNNGSSKKNCGKKKPTIDDLDCYEMSISILI